MTSEYTKIDFNEKPDSNTYWITEHFKGLTCNKYIEDPDDSTNCLCGRDKDDHIETPNGTQSGTPSGTPSGTQSGTQTETQGGTQNGTPSETQSGTQEEPPPKWSFEANTHEFFTNAYGNIDFLSIYAESFPTYLRFSHNTDINFIKDLLINKWNLKKPDLIMVVIGDESDERDSTSIDDINEGIVKAAITTNAWIMTSGFDNGVSKLVGKKAATERTFTQTIPTIGIAPWGTIRDRNKLENDRNEGSFPAKYQNTPATKMSGLKALDVNHTAFLFPDWGTHRNYHVTEMSKFKIDLEKQLKEATHANLITILIEGGLSSLIEAGKRVENNIPIVVMNGTGRAANLIGYGKDLAIEYGGINDSRFDEQLDQKFMENFTNSRDKIGNKDKALKAVKTILKNSNLVTVWDSHKKRDVGQIAKAILLGLIRSLGDSANVQRHPDAGDHSCDNLDTSSYEYNDSSGKARYMRETNQLELAIKWNRLDLAKEYLFKDKEFSVSQLNMLLWIALEHKNVRFVETIIEKGANLKIYLTDERLTAYLNHPTLLKKSILKKLMKKFLSHHYYKALDDKTYIYEHFEKVIYYISQGVYKCPRRKKKCDSSGTDKVSKKGQLFKELLCCGRFGYYHQKQMNFEREFQNAGEKMQADFEDPESLLVLYFVLIFEHDIAMCLWKHSRTPLILSLICAHICGWLADQERKTSEITSEHKKRLKEWKKEWENLAVQIVDKTYNNYDKVWVQNLIQNTFSAWGGRSVIDIALFVKSQEFMAHPGVHKYVTNMWMGNLDPDTSYSSILLNILIIFPLFVTVSTVKDSNQQLTKREDLLKEQRRKFINEDGENRKLKHEETDQSLLNIRDKKKKKKSNCSLWSPCIAVWKGIDKFFTFHRAPVTKYFVHLIFYLIFLCIFFCALVLAPDVRFTPFLEAKLQDFSILEWVVIIFMVFNIPLEIRQLYHSMPSTMLAKISTYLDNTYNKIDVLSLAFLLLAVLTKQGVFSWNTTEDTRITYQMYDIMCYKVLMGLTFTLSTTRLLQFLQINSKMGPKVSTITRMFIDLLFFISIITIFIIAYGVATEAIIYPAGKDDGLDNLWGVIWRPYMHLFGELATDDLEVKLNEGYCRLKEKLGDISNSLSYDELAAKCKATNDPGIPRYTCTDNDMGACKYAEIIVQIELGVYMMLGAILMLNLLIAVFSRTYQDMTSDNKDDLLWKWQRFDLMVEFKQRSAIPFPLSLFGYIVRTLRWFWRRWCMGISFAEKRSTQRVKDEYRRAKISLLEKECLRNIYNRIKAEKRAKSQPDNKSEDVWSSRAESPLKRLIPPFEGGNDDELEFDAGLGDLIVEAIDIPPLFSSPTTPAASRRFKELTTRYIEDIPADTTYPQSNSIHFAITAEKRNWSVNLPNYNPTHVNSKEDTATEWNVSGKNASYEGDYEVLKGYPCNPLGRTGIFGRGNLPEYGPNFKSVPILTRFFNPAKAPQLDTPLEVLVHYPNPENLDKFTLPEFDSKADEPLPSAFIKVLFESISITNGNARAHLKRILKRGILIKRGAVDHKLNTDNAWVEMFIASYHDDDESAFRALQFRPKKSHYGWRSVIKEGMFKHDPNHHRYFDRVVYNRRMSNYLGNSQNL